MNKKSYSIKKSRYFLGLVLTVFVAFSFLSCEGPEDGKVVVWPEVTNEMKPWTRWWWMGSGVNEADLAVILEDFAAKGIGGVEIAPIYGAKGYEDQYVEYLTPEWLELLQFTIAKSNSLGMGVDMTNGTGWPFGGPHITDEMAARRLFLQEYKLSAEQTDDIEIAINDRRQREHGAYLTALMAYGPNGEVLNFIEYLDENNRLTWKPEEGEWTVIAAFNGHNRMLVKRAAPGGQGFTFDHLRSEALEHYLSRFDDAFQGKNPGVRCFFNDSYEVFGASWSSGFFDEFLSRRGYDLKNYLRELNGEGDADTIARVKADYRQTMSDLLIGNFSTGWTKWANNLGAKTRNQSHGSPANLLDVYATVDIPEIETFGADYFPIRGFFYDEEYLSKADHNPLFLKMAASAANITGKKLVSCETFTWAGEHFRVPLSQIKPEAEQVFLSGVNHIFFHGSTYSPEEAMWPGWLFYASVHFGRSNSFWPHISGFNEYITRCQSILQEGVAANDILVYWPIYDTWQNEEGLEMMMSVHGSKEWLNLPNIKSLLDRGYSFDFVSDSLLGTFLVNENELLTNNKQHSYKAVIIPECKYMPVNTLELLVAYAEKGVPIIFETLPLDVPGLSNLEDRRAKMQTIYDLFTLKEEEGITIMDNFKGKLILSADFERTLDYAGVKRETFTDDGIKYLRRHSGQGLYYYMVNHTAEDIDKIISVNETASNVLMLDPQSGEYGLIPVTNKDSVSELRIQMLSGESYFLLFTDKDVSEVSYWNYYETIDEAFVLDGQWKLEFIEGGPSLPDAVLLDGIRPWTTLDKPEVESFSGSAKYSIKFDFSEKLYDDYLLDLGKVLHSARIILNGMDLGFSWSVPHVKNIGEYLLEGENELVIEVTNLMANRIRYMDIQNIEWQLFHEINFVNTHYRPFNASKWELMPSGIEGPVRIIPCVNYVAGEDGKLLDQNENTALLFDFGAKESKKNTIAVSHALQYSNKAGYGFEPGNLPTVVQGESQDFFFRNAFCSDNTFCFSVNLPEGNYELTVFAGHPNLHSSLTVKAESRRWMLGEIKTEPGSQEEHSFIVNVRRPYFYDNDSIKRKTREYSFLNWDDKLTLEFSGEKPSVYGIKIKALKNKALTVFLAGNSTVVDQENEPYASWGQMITRYFDNNVLIANYAESGESLLSFKNARRLDKILSLMKEGDYLFIEFGHNDQKLSGEGVGAYTSFSDLLKEFIAAVQLKGGIPVLVSPMHRRFFDDEGKVMHTHGDYPDAVRKVAKDENIALIDLNQMSKIVYEAWGPEESKNAFVHYPAGTFPNQDKALEDNTHFNNYGAWIMALCIMKGIREAVPELAEYFVDDAPLIDLNNPFAYSQLALPNSMMIDTNKPEGQ